MAGIFKMTVELTDAQVFALAEAAGSRGRTLNEHVNILLTDAPAVRKALKVEPLNLADIKDKRERHWSWESIARSYGMVSGYNLKRRYIRESREA